MSKKKTITNKWNSKTIKDYLRREGYKDPIFDDKIKAGFIWDMTNAPFIKMQIISMVEFDDESQEMTIKITHDGTHKQSETKFVNRRDYTKDFKAFQPGGVLHQTK